MGSPLEELRKRLNRKYLKAITKIYNTNLAEDHGKVVPNCVASALLLPQRLALPIQMKEASSDPGVFSEQLQVSWDLHNIPLPGGRSPSTTVNIHLLTIYDGQERVSFRGCGEAHRYQNYGACPQITCTGGGGVWLKPCDVVGRAQALELDTAGFKPCSSWMYGFEQVI